MLQIGILKFAFTLGQSAAITSNVGRDLLKRGSAGMFWEKLRVFGTLLCGLDQNYKIKIFS